MPKDYPDYSIPVIEPPTAGEIVDTKVVPNMTATKIVEWIGAGRCDRITVETDHDMISILFLIDDVEALARSLIPNDSFNPNALSLLGYSAATPRIQLLQWAAGGTCKFVVDIPMSFRYKISVWAAHNLGVNHNVTVGLLIQKAT